MPKVGFLGEGKLREPEHGKSGQIELPRLILQIADERQNPHGNKLDIKKADGRKN